MIQDNIHLLHRSSFGLTVDDFHLAKKYHLTELVDHIIQTSNTQVDLPVNINFRKKLLQSTKGKRVQHRLEKREITMRWLNQMAFAKEQLREKMGLFWHDHFPVNIEEPEANISYVNQIRYHALGKFGDLIKAVSKEKAMIKYLHLHKNVKDQPNENFARELLELFTLGIDNYTEDDIVEIARAFTGWTIVGAAKFKIRPRFHDKGVKTIFGQKGNFNGEDVLDLVLENRKTSIYITKKIWTYFSGNAISKPLLKKLSSDFYADDYHIGNLIKKIFLSPEFYQEENKHNRIKSPTNLLVSHLRLCQLTLKVPAFVNQMQIKMGQVLLVPPNVSGWTQGTSWIDLNNVYFRLELGSYLLNNTGLKIKKAVLSLEGDEEDSYKSTKASFNFSLDQLETFYKEHLRNDDSYLMLLLYNKQHAHLQPLLDLLSFKYQKKLITFQNVYETLSAQPEFQLN